MPCAQGDGDVVTATAIPGKPGLVVIESVTGDDGRLPLEPDRNCVGIAALEALEMINEAHGRPACGVALRLEKVRGVDVMHCNQSAPSKLAHAGSPV